MKPVLAIEQRPSPDLSTGIATAMVRSMPLITSSGVTALAAVIGYTYLMRQSRPNQAR
jgi:hypothetical protein